MCVPWSLLGDYQLYIPRIPIDTLGLPWSVSRNAYTVAPYLIPRIYPLHLPPRLRRCGRGCDMRPGITMLASLCIETLTSGLVTQMTCLPKGTADRQLVLLEWWIFLTSSATGRNSSRDRAGVPVLLGPRLHFVRVEFQLHIIFQHPDPMLRASCMPTTAAARGTRQDKVPQLQGHSLRWEGR
ncbi:hypothetical protein QBC32DRAFT_369298 [Pseudoneurospora amorphoporcata]|uniref:Uncharacterized protein n=1 Tax=Pseudoneurospora amorphoporcata TaxID=241081 RepID=A0AAN6NXB3_9PEZI|nr:hypothetical protein QBC32DRAFT_369298 [Pseudoneurospora amorphoporcata]